MAFLLGLIADRSDRCSVHPLLEATKHDSIPTPLSLQFRDQPRLGSWSVESFVHTRTPYFLRGDKRQTWPSTAPPSRSTPHSRSSFGGSCPRSCLAAVGPEGPTSRSFCADSRNTASVFSERRHLARADLGGKITLSCPICVSGYRMGLQSLSFFPPDASACASLRRDPADGVCEARRTSTFSPDVGRRLVSTKYPAIWILRPFIE